MTVRQLAEHGMENLSIETRKLLERSLKSEEKLFICRPRLERNLTYGAQNSRSLSWKHMVLSTYSTKVVIASSYCKVGREWWKFRSLP